MVEERVTDGIRIAHLLASELDGREDGGLDRLAVTNVDPDVEPATEGAHAFDVTHDGSPLSSVFVHTDRISLTVADSRDVALETARAVGLQVDTNSVSTNPDGSNTDESNGDGSPPARIVVERGAAVKRATDVLGAVSRAVSADDEIDGTG